MRRVAEVARLFADSGTVALVALISPYRAGRQSARAIHEDVGLKFLEVFVDTPLEVCEERDVKGFYALARAGEMPGFTGVDGPFERPEAPDLVLTPDDGPALAAATRVLDLLA
jgi:bifunctional enzyme CysN/CysC